jgi:5,10-methylenetetrahydromethanopterin reductase
MSEELTFSLRCNNDLSVRDFTELAVAADNAGLDQIWVSDDLFFNSAMVMLTSAAVRTSRIRLGTGIVNPYTIHPAEMAMFVRSLAEVSDGRAMLGVAAGADDFLSWIGVQRTRPLTTVRESVSGLRYLLDGFTNNERPAVWTSDARMSIGDEFASLIPVYIGAMSPRMLHLAGEVADGVLPLLFPPERYVEARDQVLAGVEAAGRSASEVDIAACIWCSVAEDRDEAIEALARKIAYFGPSFSPHVLNGIGLEAGDLMPARIAHMEGDLHQAVRLLPAAALRLGIAGDATDVVDRISDLFELGATHISFGPPLGPKLLPALELLRTSVLPPLQELASRRRT